MELAVINRPSAVVYSSRYRIGKRLLDLAICILLLPVAAPLLAVCFVVIRIDSAGPGLFKQERIGKGGRPFRMYKLRTMRYDLDYSHHQDYMRQFVRGCTSTPSHFATCHPALAKTFVGKHLDPASQSKMANKPVQAWQTTRVGRILRKTSLDELPQIFNVLKGEMSLVGPRPNVRCEVEECQPWHCERLEVLPGITGLAQIHGRSCISFDYIAMYDVQYIREWSLSLDLRILFLTMVSVFKEAGAL